MTSYNGFVWPKKGKVFAPDWDEKKECGNGLHGFLWGEGDAGLASKYEDAIWIVAKVKEGECVDLNGKVKFPSAHVVFCGSREQAVQIIQNNAPHGKKINWSTVTGGYKSTVTGGDWSTVTGGNRSTVTGGNMSTVTGGDGSTVTGGNWSTVTGGDGSTVTGGYWSTVTGGNWSTVTGGNMSTVTGGDGSTVTGGNWSTVTGGDGSTVTGGYRSTVTGGDGAVLIIKKILHGRGTNFIAEVGERGIKPNTPYQIDENGMYLVISQDLLQAIQAEAFDQFDSKAIAIDCAKNSAMMGDDVAVVHVVGEFSGQEQLSRCAEYELQPGKDFPFTLASICPWCWDYDGETVELEECGLGVRCPRCKKIATKQQVLAELSHLVIEQQEALERMERKGAA
ncbi:hypothetical protein AAG570_014018 [Ranatra chinensis]|uniref:Uncharacterized protein n=1 Tax=Ranatra chinensis TaxID=642074 RepID=A0ABD0XS40_9HEMI